MSSLQPSCLQSSTALSWYASSCNFCQMYLYSNITGLCLEQFYFPSANPGMFHAGGWCTECWNSPQELFLQEQKAGSGPTVNLEPKAGAAQIFRLLIPTLFTSGGEKVSSPCQVATRGWCGCLLTETTPRQPWAPLQTDRLQQSTHQLINLCQNSFVKHLPTTCVFWNTLQQDKKGELVALWPGHLPC